MKNLKSISVFVLIMIFALSFTNCENETIKEEALNSYISEKVNLNEIINSKLKQSNKATMSKNTEINTIHAELKTNLEIPNNLSESELEHFLSENMNEFTGSLEIKINDITDVIFEYSKGELINTNYSNKALESLARKIEGDCSFEGVRVCARDKMYAKSKLSKIICAFSFPECYAEEVGNCIIDNCF